MKSSHNLAQKPTFEPTKFEEISVDSVDAAVQKLTDYIQTIIADKNSKPFSEHEQMITRLTNKIGRNAIAKSLSQYDVSSDMISIGEQVYRKKHCHKRTYQSSLGPVELERHVYVNRKKDGDGKSICPLELQTGIVEHYWTPRAAKNAAWALAHLTPQECEDMFIQFGGMMPSKSSLDRLPKAINLHWEPQTIQHHEALIDEEIVPCNATTMAISLDGVMIAMKAAKTATVRGKAPGCEWREASCGTVSFYDQDGERLSTFQYGRMPESNKLTLKSLLKQHVEKCLAQNPKLKLVYVADGARDNWTFFDEELPLGFHVVDFYHACEYLKSGFEAAYDKKTATEKFETYKQVLKDEPNGIDKVIRAFRYLRDKDKTNEDVVKTLKYLTNNRERMDYAKAQKLNYPIGSGVVEATCKTLVGQRLKRSGMTWRFTGGQSILTVRSLVKSHRFDRAWEMFAKNYKKEVKIHGNVVALSACN